MSQPIETTNEPTNEETVDFVPLKDFEDDYEILNQYPFTIRKKSNHRVIKEHISNNGYYRLALNGENYKKHRLIAKQFLPNPDNLPQVDHINRNRSDNHLSNLRWVSSSENCKNKSSYKGINHEYIDKLPNDSFEIEYYDTRNGRRQLIDYYYSPSTDSFYFDNEINYRILPSHEINGSPVVCMRDVDNKVVSLVIARFKDQQGII